MLIYLACGKTPSVIGFFAEFLLAARFPSPATPSPAGPGTAETRIRVGWGTRRGAARFPGRTTLTWRGNKNM